VSERPGPERQPLVGYLGCSFVLHLGLVGLGLATPFGALLASALVPSCHEPIVKPTIEVSVVSLPKRLNVPDRATRVKANQGVKAEEPPPVKESDLKFEDDKPDPKAGNTEEQRRQEILDEIKRKQLLEQLDDANEGPVDRNPTDPNGTAEDMENAVLGAQAQGDPEFARWNKAVKDAVMQNFHPLGGATGLVCVVKVELDVATGQVTAHEVLEPSGVLSFDAAAERALDDTPNLPLPPEKYRPLVADEGFKLRFVPK
jgi:hypothetical protein